MERFDVSLDPFYDLSKGKQVLLQRKVYLACAAVLVAAFFSAASASQFDRGGSDWLHDHLRALDPGLQILTFAGDSALLIPVCVAVALFLYFTKRKSF